MKRSTGSFGPFVFHQVWEKKWTFLFAFRSKSHFLGTMERQVPSRMPFPLFLNVSLSLLSYCQQSGGVLKHLTIFVQLFSPRQWVSRGVNIKL